MRRIAVCMDCRQADACKALWSGSHSEIGPFAEISWNQIVQDIHLEVQEYWVLDARKRGRSKEEQLKSKAGPSIADLELGLQRLYSHFQLGPYIRRRGEKKPETELHFRQGITSAVLY